MKKILVLTLVILCAVATCSCSSSQDDQNPKKTKIANDVKTVKEQYENDKNKQLDSPPTEAKTSGDAKEAGDPKNSAISNSGSISLTKANNADNNSQIVDSSTSERLSNGNIDIDLTRANSNIIYGQIAQMLATPEEYVGKMIKLSGTFLAYDPAPDSQANVDKYFAVMVADAAACCQQGMEFIWPGHNYPDQFPAQYANMTITGKFQTYTENGKVYCQIIADSVEF